MRGGTIPSASGRRSQRNEARDEIRRAIDEVRYSEDPMGTGYEQMHVRPVLPEPPYVIPRFVFVDPIDRVDGSTAGPIRGQAPLAFLGWFEQLRSQLEDQQTMLSRCHFEEAD